MAVSALISITWLMFGYSLSFGHDHTGTNTMAYKNRFIGGANMFWFWGDGKDAGTAGRSFHFFSASSCMIHLSQAVVCA